jgi:hypothetical protein
MFTQQDLQQIADHGLTPEQVETQLANFRRGFPFLNVVRAASPGDGVTVELFKAHGIVVCGESDVEKL